MRRVQSKRNNAVIVSAKRVAVVAGVLAAVFVFGVFGMVRVPGVAVRLFGGAAGGIARYGGVVAHWVPPPGLDVDALQRRFEERGVGARLRRDGAALVVEVAEVREEEAETVTSMMTEGRLVFREVIESMATYKLAALGLASEPPRHGEPAVGITVEIDQWRSEDTNGQHTDSYAHAASREALVAMFAEAERRGWERPPHTVVAFERIEPSIEARHPRVFWRSYLLSDEVSLDGMSVADATGSYDPNTNRPIVLLEFDRAGGRAFGELTSRIVGHKLAIVVGGDVRSAPVIQSAIRGGRASITMGGSDPVVMERERDAMVRTYRAGTLPLGGKLLDSHWVAPSQGRAESLGHIAVAVAAGLVAALLAWLAITVTKPERRVVVPIEGTGGRKRRLAWTLLAVALYGLGTAITIPWVNGLELAHLTFGHGAGHTNAAAGGLDFASIFTLGMAPLLSAFILVEIVASLVPGLRRYRDGSAERRRWLGLAVVVVALLTATTQAMFVERYFEGASSWGVELLDHGGKWPTIATLVAGTMCFAWLASIISERGIGNGYAVLAIAGLLDSVFNYWWWHGMVVGGHLLLAAVAVVAIATITIAMLGWRVRSPRSVAIPIPASGIAPLNPGAGALLLVVQVLALGIAAPAGLVTTLDSLQRGVVVGVLVVIAGSVAWAIAFAWPGRRRTELAAVARDPADLRVWTRALVLSTGGLLAIFAISHVTIALAPELAFVVDPLVLLLVVASLADLGAEWRARRRDLVAVWPLHDPLLVDIVGERLAQAGIPHHIQATRLRSLLWLFGSFAPQMVLVPREHGTEASKLLHDWLQPV